MDAYPLPCDCSAGGGVAIFGGVIGFYVLAQFLRVACDWWVSRWAQQWQDQTSTIYTVGA